MALLGMNILSAPILKFMGIGKNFMSANMVVRGRGGEEGKRKEREIGMEDNREGEGEIGEERERIEGVKEEVR